MSIKIKIGGNFDPEKLGAKGRAAAQLSLQQSALEVQNKAKRLAPFLTGNLRRSITHEVKPLSAKIGTDVVYARIQEFGGRAGRNRKVRIPPYKGRGYLRPALKESVNKIKEIFNKNLKRYLNVN